MKGKAIGIVLIALGLGGCGLAALWLIVGATMEHKLSPAALVLGLGLAFIVIAPLLGGGFVILRRSGEEAKAMAYAEMESKLLGMVKAQGQVEIARAALELGLNRDQVKEMIYDLVHKGFFSGYINWEEGILYSQEASKLKEGARCPNCGGQLELAGKGVVRCPYCGTEIFLS